MKSPLEDKLNLLAVTATTNRGMAPYGPAVEEVRVSSMIPARSHRPKIQQDMAAAIFTMNKALQGKIKELQHGDVSGNVAGLRELEASIAQGLKNALALILRHACLRRCPTLFDL